jgi:ABC-type sugar transport system ATPase subunit
VASIQLEQVTKTYAGGAPAVQSLTLDVPDGELLVLVGPSGSGKSTVLRLIAGLETADTGRIVIGGNDVSAVPPQRRDLAMVFQSYALYPHKTVRENMAFALKVRGVPGAEIDARVQRAAATLNIGDLLHRKPAQLSGGQRQRVALGRAIVREPKAFLLDEPLSNLDPRLRVETRAELAMLHRRLAATMVYVTHDQEEAMTLGQRIAIMRNGTLEQVGSPLDLFDRPANVFVAGFIGSPAMNIWPAARLGSDVLGRMGAAARDRLVGVRPHDIELVSSGDADASGSVEIVEFLGSTTLVHVRPGDAAELVRVAVTPEAGVTIGDRVAIRLRRDRLHVFDRDSGQRIVKAG